ncbi:BTB/POZ domain-containing protein At5g48130 [Silene latifolia]|uniref:BTB/POZ domain-containing protein At5g48130 n=1 Tax=Silene latifolia TaxID=37657 RepID=UPI003D7834CA
MEAYSPKESSFLSSPYSSPNLTALLKIKIISWSQETGLPVTVRVRVAEKSFNLHKFPLMAKSGYFKRQLSEWQEVELPANFPGGSETFEMIALFIYGSSTFIDPFNVASLRCASEFLEMTEAYASGNLSSRTDLYLNQVVLQSWDDTLIVLQKCQTLHPWAEDLLIVSRCIESLAFMACMEILDPERKRERPIASLDTLSTHPWSCDIVKEIVSQDLWIKDLIALKFGFFKRIISSLRRQGMRERFVSPIIVFYANKWVLSKKTRQFWECLCDKESDNNVNDSSDQVMEILQGILDLLLIGEKGSRVIPVGFYFALLARSLELGGLNDGRLKLQEQIIHLLPLAHVEDFLIPREPNELISSSMELAIMESIFSRYFSSFMTVNETPPMGNTIVAELWDLYLVRVARDSGLTVDEFMKLVEVVPVSCRNSHDHLYRAMNVYIQGHPALSQEEKSLVCKQLICQKLSQEVCIEAVQNELMPLRLIVQALFVQQLNTQQAFRHCSDSFRFAYSGDLSGTLSNPKTNNLQESPFTDGSHIANNPLKSLLENELDLQRPDIPRNEYESTSFRIQNLEQELVSLKKSLRLQQSVKDTDDFPGFSSKIRSFSKRRDAFGQVTGCIGSVNFSSQRKYAGKLLKIFRRVSLFGRGKLKRRPSVSGS